MSHPAQRTCDARQLFCAYKGLVVLPDQPVTTSAETWLATFVLGSPRDVSETPVDNTLDSAHAVVLDPDTLSMLGKYVQVSKTAGVEGFQK